MSRNRTSVKFRRKISEENAGAKVLKRPDGMREYRGKWEPGPYYLFQVFRKKKKNKYSL